MKNNKYSFTWLGRLLIYLITIPLVILIFVLLSNTRLPINSTVLLVLTIIAGLVCAESDSVAELVIYLFEKIIKQNDLSENRYLKHIIKTKKAYQDRE